VYSGKFRPSTYVVIFKRIRKIDVKKLMDEIKKIQHKKGKFVKKN
jgi:hypothetical protein